MFGVNNVKAKRTIRVKYFQGQICLRPNILRAKYVQGRICPLSKDTTFLDFGTWHIKGLYTAGLWDLAYQRTLHCWTLGHCISKNITLPDSGTWHIKEHYTAGLWDLAYQRTFHCWTLGVYGATLLGISKDSTFLNSGLLEGDITDHF